MFSRILNPVILNSNGLRIWFVFFTKKMAFSKKDQLCVSLGIILIYFDSEIKMLVELI